MPALSVVIATRSRVGRLRALLESLADSDSGEDVEVIMVADGATDEVLAVLEGGGAAVQALRLDPGRGPAAARNAGWRAARAPLVAFTDDDCVAAPGWAHALLAAAAQHPGAVVQGRVEPLPAERERIRPFTRSLHVHAAGPFFQTANIAYPRALLEALGGFDERYAQPAGEDTDLGWRAAESGAGAVFAPAALIWHAVHEPGWRGIAADAARWGTAVALVKRHPGVRAHFHHRVFWKPAHEKLLLAAAGLALAPRTRGASLGAVAPWLAVHHGEHLSAASLLRCLPAHLAVDAAEVVAMARGSARERTLLL